MTEELVKAFLALAGVALTVWGTLSVSRRSDKAQRRKDDQDAAAKEQSRIQSVEDSLWSRMESRLKEQDAKIEDLTKRLDDSEKARRAQDIVIRKLEDQGRDREELIQDFLERHVAVEAWFDAGKYTPSLPDPTWRISQAVEQYKNDLRSVGG